MIRNTGQPTSTVEQTDKGDKKVDENLARPDSKSSRDVFFRLQEYAYRKFPWIISDPKLHERLTAWRKRDEKDNTKSTPRNKKESVHAAFGLSSSTLRRKFLPYFVVL